MILLAGVLLLAAIGLVVGTYELLFGGSWPWWESALAILGGGTVLALFIGVSVSETADPDE